MNQSMVRPYFYQAVQHSYFLNLNQQQDLTLSKSNVQGEWGREKILQQNCSRFVAAPDDNDCLHIIAADSNNKLSHIIVTIDQVQTKPFITQGYSGPFLLSFSANGMGYLFYTEDNKSGKLKAAKYSSVHGWSEELAPEQSSSVPMALAIDNCSNFHLLLYDLTNETLNYHFRNQEKRWADPFRLDSGLQMSLLPALWVTAGHNIHIAWFLPHKNTVCYRMKKAGGWPVGGWQHEQYLPLNTAPNFISLHEEAESVKVWCIGTESKLDVFYQQNGNWLQVREETDDCLPVRHGTLGGELYNLASSLPPTNLFFTKTPSQITNEHAVGHRLETNTLPSDLNKSKQQEEDFLAAIHNLEEEYRQCQNEIKSLNEHLEQVQKELSAKDDAITNYQAETDTLRSGLTKSKQQEENLLVTIRKMEQKCRQYQHENKSLNEQLKQLQKKLSAKDDAIINYQAETNTLRSGLTKSKQQEEDLLATIRKMKKEMESKKGLLYKISSAFHRKK